MVPTNQVTIEMGKFVVEFRTEKCIFMKSCIYLIMAFLTGAMGPFLDA